MNQDALRKRYTYLWTGEALAAVAFSALLVWSIYLHGIWQQWIARTYSVLVIINILLQGVVWWRIKLHLLNTDDRHVSSPIRDAFAFCRRINWLLIGLFPVIVILASRLTHQSLVSLDTALGLLFLGGAVLEQINYYYVQLMYDSAYDWAYLRTHHRLRRGSIAKVLDASPEAKFGVGMAQAMDVEPPDYDRR